MRHLATIALVCASLTTATIATAGPMARVTAAEVEPSTPSAAPITPADADADADAARYAAAEAQQPAAADFTGGSSIVIIGSTTALLVALLILIIIL